MRSSGLRWGCLLCSLFAGHNSSSDPHGPIRAAAVSWIYRTAEARVAFPSADEFNVDLAMRTVAILQEPFIVPGIPATRLRRQLTVSFVRHMSHEVDGTIIPEHNMIIMPLDRALTWEIEYLRRVLRHEWTHLLTRTRLEGVTLPRWFDEGYAEWAAGGITCNMQARLDLSQQISGSEQRPRRLTQDEFSTQRVAYDHFASFVDYLDVSHNNIISSGRLFEGLRTGDVYTVLERETAMPFHILLRHWWHDMRHGRYRPEQQAASRCTDNQGMSPHHLRP